MPDAQDKVGRARPSIHRFNGLQVEHLGPLPAAMLRVRAVEAARAAAALAPLGLDLPLAPNTVRLGDRRLIWTGPGEWLLMVAEGCLPDLAAIGAALGDIPHLLADITDGREVIALSGGNARTLLAKGCSLDLHPRQFTTGRCAQTLLARVPVLLMQTRDEPRFDLVVDRSLAAYLREWISVAAGGFRPDDAQT
ncbi:sarcosine oxidase subunit gamma [Niveispirillum sp.]|uniref:sarcosine oxidase subunit gamma n=1 Tax=Niveispirillum sp. TaxID=1917217 RepID=UPI001B74834E|nr:sarcosine oxidase subunit gamma family protein [Niveispirillum sp.]MBP7336005.1 hypothetical protein [Niveispirillum sp.]